MKKRVTLLIVSIVLGLWAILPDPVPVVVDDVIAGIGSAATLLGLIATFIKKDE